MLYLYSAHKSYFTALHHLLLLLPISFSPKYKRAVCRKVCTSKVNEQDHPDIILFRLPKLYKIMGNIFVLLTLSQMSTPSRIRCECCYCGCYYYYYYHPCFDVCLLCYVLFFVYLCVLVVVLRLFYGFSHSFSFSLAQTHSHSLIYLPTPSSSRILTANKPKNGSVTLAVALVLFWWVLQNCIYTFDRTLFQ